MTMDTDGDEIPVHEVRMYVCQACLDGAGEECHTPGCALYLHRVDIPISPGLYEIVDPTPPASVKVTDAGESDAAPTSVRLPDAVQTALIAYSKAQWEYGRSCAHEGCDAADSFDAASEYRDLEAAIARALAPPSTSTAAGGTDDRLEYALGSLRVIASGDCSAGDAKAFAKAGLDLAKRRNADGETDDGWRPIETAPRDGTLVLVVRDMGAPWGWIRGTSKWDGAHGIYGWISRGLYDPPGELGLGAPTHWHPLPTPPGTPAPSAMPSPAVSEVPERDITVGAFCHGCGGHKSYSTDPNCPVCAARVRTPEPLKAGETLQPGQVVDVRVTVDHVGPVFFHDTSGRGHRISDTVRASAPVRHDAAKGEAVAWQWNSFDGKDCWRTETQEKYAKQNAHAFGGKVRPLYAAPLVQPSLAAWIKDERAKWPVNTVAAVVVHNLLDRLAAANPILPAAAPAAGMERAVKIVERLTADWTAYGWEQAKDAILAALRADTRQDTGGMK